MRRLLKLFLILVVVIVATVSASDTPLGREPLDNLWQQHMVQGTAATIQMKDSTVVKSTEIVPAILLAIGQPEAASGTIGAIVISRLDEGFWRNGGWVLAGGVLARVKDGPITVELYGKAVVRRLPHFPLSFHQAIPHETGYEFFLLQRRQGIQQATVVRKWVIPAEDVIVENRSGGGSWEDVRGALKVDINKRIATVTITGLKRPFEERVALSTIRESSSR